MSDKRHWYVITVLSGGGGRKIHYDILKIGFREKPLTDAKLKFAMESSPKGEGVPVAITYLGLMTAEEFNAPLPKDW